MKVCTKCGIEKDESEFYKQKNNKSGLSAQCCICKKKYRESNLVRERERVKQWRKDNPERQKEAVKKYKEKNLNYVKELNKQWSKSKKAKDSKKEYYEKKKIEIQEKQKRWRTSNRGYRVDYEKNRKINNEQYYLSCKLRNRIRTALKRQLVLKTNNFYNLCGCDIEFLKLHIEKQFDKDMSWENRVHWHIDHIIPCSAFDLSKESEQLKAFNYLNLRPLLSSSNIIKKDNLDYDLIEKHNIWHLLPESIKIKRSA